MVGKKLGQYEIVEPLGSGGMGDVYRALDTNLRRDVAIKVLPEAMSADAERLARLQREAHLLAAVNHPNIAAIYNLEESGGTRWLVLELVEGETLEQRLRRGPLSVAEALRIAGQVAGALEAAHDKGIVHRDLKAANVMVDAKGRVKVLDFGIAKDVSGAVGTDASTDTAIATQADHMAQLTATGVIVGTVPYMSPEQIRGKGVDKRTDNWAFGCLLFELLTGRRPFDRETMADTLSAVLEHDPDWRFLPDDTPEAVQTLIRRCLNKDPDGRLHDIADARIELAEIEATGTGVSARAGVVGGSVVGPWSAPRAGILATAGVLAVITLVVGYGLWSALSVRDPGAGGEDRTATGATVAADDAIDPRSVAVLPLVAPNAESVEHADAMALWIRGRLQSVGDLSVAAAASSELFRDSSAGAAEIGRELGVALIVTGSVQFAADTLGVQVDVVDAATGFIFQHLQEALPAEDMGGIFDFQEAVARAVVTALEIELSDDQTRRLEIRPTLSVEANDAYLRGMRAWPLRTPDALNEAQEHFERAIALDADFSLAYAGLANTYLLMNNYAGLSRREAVALARENVDEALRLDPDSPEAAAALGFVMHRAGDPEWEAQLDRALELNPSNELVHHFLGDRFFGRPGADALTRSVEHTRRAWELDRLQIAAIENLGYRYLAQGEFERAEAQMRRAIALDADYPLGHMGLGVVLHYAGRAGEALDPLREGRRLSPNDVRHVKNLAEAYAALGRDLQAVQTVTGWIAADPDDWRPYDWLGDINLHASAPEEAISRYRQAEELRGIPQVHTKLAIAHLDLADESAAEANVIAAEQVAESLPLSNQHRRWAELGRLNLEMYRGRFAENADRARAVAEQFYPTSRAGGPWLAQHPREPLGYFGVLAGRPEDSVAFFETNFPDLLADDPVIHSLNLKAAIDLAAVLQHTSDADRAGTLLERSEAYLQGVPDEQRNAQFRDAPMQIYALQGRADDAFDAMELAFADGWRSGWWRLPHKPHFASIRDDPRFAEMVERLRAATSG